VSNVTIVSFDEEYSSIFYELNKLWIEESWLLEKSDKFDLLNPKESIIDKGGEIFFALIDGNVIGTVAMIRSSDRIYELAKMTVDINYRGNGVANKLMDQCLDYAINNNAQQIYLITNDTLVIARNLYDKYGFKEVKLDSDKYLRGNVKMALNLTER
tara:strand:+ start:3773 stop:4243 length:471 start_codon:yes stop_codon:yes gene_type:complete